MLSTLWVRAPLIAAGLVAALALASVVLVLIGPSFTGRAMIQFNFIREELSTGVKSVSTASVDAMAVVDSAAPVIRSHAIANAVVTRLGLDKDPAFARGSILWRVFSSMRSLFGFEEKVASNHDLAEGQLIRRIAVASDPRSYLVSISVTAPDPDAAARLANAVALEYLRGQLLQQMTDSYAAAERRMSELSSIYGIRHPAYQSEQSKLENLRLRLRELREEPFDEDVASGVPGQSFVAAHKVMIPSGPDILLILGLTAVAELGLGAWLALQARPNELQRTQFAPLRGWRNKLRRIRPAAARSPNKPPRSHGLASSSEPVLASVRKSDEIFALIGYHKVSLAWLSIWFATLALVSATTRGATLAVVVSVTIAMLALRRYRLMLATVVLAVGTFAALLTPESAFGEYEEAKNSIERPVSAHQIVENAKSIIEQSGQQTEGTKRWRLNWWDIIINETIYGPNFWTGRSFGLNLADADGFTGTSNRRNPLIILKGYPYVGAPSGARVRTASGRWQSGTARALVDLRRCAPHNRCPGTARALPQRPEAIPKRRVVAADAGANGSRHACI